MTTRWTDPIVAEIRAVRDERAARLDYDVAAIFADIRRMQDESDAEYVRLPGRPAAVDVRSRATE